MLAKPELATITTSLTGKRWQIRAADERQVLSYMQKYGLPELVCRLLSARGIAYEAVEGFLNPNLKTQLPDPSHLLDMDKAAARVVAAIANQEKIAIFGDYDVDGATSSALLLRFLRQVGAKSPIVYIPDRMSEGYGPNTPAMLKLKEQGVSLVITVDCGTMAFEPLQAAYDVGLDVIVVDHHMGEARKPAAYAIVNPNRLDETSEHRQMAAVGVSFLLAVAVNRLLREQGKKTADLLAFLDLVALGTICDVVPLTGVNRAFVAQGLKLMAARQNLGMTTALDLAKVEDKPGVYHVGFVLGPRINAGGRVGRSDLGVRLLTTEDDAEALQLAKELEQHNNERKAIEQLVQEQAVALAEVAASEDHPLLLVSSTGWHPGVIGIVASRLKDRFHKPTAVVAIENGIGKASARSVSGFDMGAAVIAACEAGLLLAGGGHAMAAGFTVEAEKLPALHAFLDERARPSSLAVSDNVRRLVIDAELSLDGLTAELVELVEQLGPFGQSNPSLRFMIRQVHCFKPSIVGQDHVRVMLGDRLGKQRLSAIAFRAADSPLGLELVRLQNQPVDLAVQISAREWMGKKMVNVQIEDIALAG
ncbi:MAG: single-stranded-DNA-specific exonuclease RecJ [Rickettsiales bacterium]|nr:single-stranded-DNA-specific exonuclease RecJ [Rickettsiales bacterium]